MVTVDFRQNKISEGTVNNNTVRETKTVPFTTSGQLNGASILRPVIPSSFLDPEYDKVDSEIAEEHKSEPIKDLNDIKMVTEYLVKEGRYRDNMLFIIGINFGLRISDLLSLRFCDIINDDLTFKTTFAILEQKTKNTRSRRRNRYITINSAVADAVMLYLSHTSTRCNLGDYIFRGESNRSDKNKPLHRASADTILKNIAKELNLTNKMSTHTLRKTFAYHQMVMSNNDPRKLLLLQKMFGHSSAAQTLDYIGITEEEIEQAYLELNLGSSNNYLINSVVREVDAC